MVSGERRTPLWLKAASRGNASARPVVSEELHCRFDLFEEWDRLPAVKQFAMEVTGVCRGPDERDWLTISFMPKAVPGHNMLSWFEAPLSLVGFPDLMVQPSPELLWWDRETTVGDYPVGLTADEAHALVGLARFPSGVARVYMLLARKEHFAWKVFLSFGSTAGSGDELACMRDDDKRAEVVFGALELTAP